MYFCIYRSIACNTWNHESKACRMIEWTNDSFCVSNSLIGENWDMHLRYRSYCRDLCFLFTKIWIHTCLHWYLHYISQSPKDGPCPKLLFYTQVTWKRYIYIDWCIIESIKKAKFIRYMHLTKNLLTHACNKTSIDKKKLLFEIEQRFCYRTYVVR